MNESKTPFEKGWLETSRDDNNGIKIAHYFSNEKSECGKYTTIPADVKVNESPSIHCMDCEDKMKTREVDASIADKKDDESDIGKNQDCDCKSDEHDECKTEERSPEEIKKGASENIPQTKIDAEQDYQVPSSDHDSEMKQDTIEKHNSQP